MSGTSQATVCSAEDDTSDDLPVTFVSNSSGVWAVDTPTNVQIEAAEHTRLCNEAATALEYAARQHPSPRKPSSKVLSRQGTTAEHRQAESTSAEEASPYTSNDVEHHRERGVDVPRSRRGLAVLGEIHADAFPTSSRPHYEAPHLSSARARRRNARSHDTSVAYDGPELQHVIQARRIQRVPTSWHPDVPQPVPELILPDGELEPRPAMNPALDPGAPVFVPRIRFGTVVSSSGEDDVAVTAPEPQWSSMDSTHSSSNLRLRSSAEQNVDPPFRHRVNASTQQNRQAQPAHRRRSRLSDQNDVARDPAPILERYPLLRPSTRHVPQRHTSGSHRTVVMPGHRYSRSPSTASLHAAATAVHQEEVPLVPTAPPALVQLDGPEEHAPYSRALSPPVSFSSRSTPNLLHPALSGPRVPSDSSSFASARIETPASRRIPSMVSAASGASSIISNQPSYTVVDAATELLQMRNSPLDDLTERLSRISFSRPRSAGRSWDRPPTRKARVSLLAGDPFRQEPSPVPPSSPTPAATDAAVAVSGAVHVLGTGTVGHLTSSSGYHALTSNEALPIHTLASSPTLVSSPALPSTPPAGVAKASSPRQPLDQRSPAKARETPGSAVRRKPVPKTPGTPRVRVYNDAEPSHTQPQTPADISASTRRRRGRSDSLAHQTPSEGRSLMTSMPVIPERHPHRNTYPSTTPPHPTAQGTPSSGVPGASISMSSVQPQHVRTNIRVLQRASDESENDIVNGLEEHLEEDRRTWLGRREGGSLDTTPPAEGRFERYLS